MAKKVLIVEDELPLQRIMADKLSSAGLQVSVASNGEEGLASSRHQLPDAILLDILLPKMDGLSMLKSLRATSWGRSIPVMILSNLKDNDHIAQAIVDGQAEGYMIKADWKLSDVVEKVQELVHA